MVLPIKKIINHPSYSTDGPGGGYDISVYFVDDTKLKEDGVVKEGVIYPVCLPTDGEISQGKKGIFASWKDPAPLYVYYSFDFDRSVQRYRNDELVLRHNMEWLQRTLSLIVTKQTQNIAQIFFIWGL